MLYHPYKLEVVNIILHFYMKSQYDLVQIIDFYYGLITSDATAGEVPGNVTPCTDFESRIYMLKGKKVQEVR